MPQYNISGVLVDFPFEAYEAQLVYMEKVVLALEAGENALLESPTGTGKTLCLLCATLAWQRAMQEKHCVQDRHIVSQPRETTPARLPGHVTSQWVEGLQTATSVSGGVAPNTRLPRIIYSSRTHSQLQQVVRELRRTVHRPKVCVLASREQLCVHHEVSRLSGTAQSAACQALTASSSCSFHRRLQEEKRKAGGILPHPDEITPEAQRTLLDVEDFASVSKRREICPFFFAREIQRSADILFLPYNYLIDAAARSALDINLAQGVPSPVDPPCGLLSHRAANTMPHTTSVFCSSSSMPHAADQMC
jgi:regulator of telomere elongation helicase 1